MADSSALISFFLKEPGWEELGKHLTLVTTIELNKKEIYNAVWRAIITSRLKEEQAKEVLRLVKEYFECCVVMEDQEPLLDKALELATRYKLTVYDSLFVTLSIIKGLPLISLDKKQRKVAKELGVNVLP